MTLTLQLQSTKALTDTQNSIRYHLNISAVVLQEIESAKELRMKQYIDWLMKSSSGVTGMAVQNFISSNLEIKVN